MTRRPKEEQTEKEPEAVTQQPLVDLKDRLASMDDRLAFLWRALAPGGDEWTMKETAGARQIVDSVRRGLAKSIKVLRLCRAGEPVPEFLDVDPDDEETVTP